MITTVGDRGTFTTADLDEARSRLRSLALIWEVRLRALSHDQLDDTFATPGRRVSWSSTSPGRPSVRTQSARYRRSGVTPFALGTLLLRQGPCGPLRISHINWIDNRGPDTLVNTNSVGHDTSQDLAAEGSHRLNSPGWGAGRPRTRPTSLQLSLPGSAAKAARTPPPRRS